MYNPMYNLSVFDGIHVVVTVVFTALIIGCGLLSASFSRRGAYDRLVAQTPNLLTSTGILGTFVGILLGLWKFNYADVDSINTLLSGLKTAFITSIVGLFSSILFKFLSSTSLLVHRERGVDEDLDSSLLAAVQSQSKQLEAMHKAIAGDEESSLAGQIKLFRNDARDRHDAFSKELLTKFAGFSEALSGLATEQAVNKLEGVVAGFDKNFLEASRLQGKQLEAMHKAIAGDEESSLAGRINRFKNDIDARHDAFSKELWDRLTDFSNMMSKVVTEQMFKALKDVITDFNKKLTEQFGDNFKELNIAVYRLVEWQENYRVQLEQMSTQYQQGVEAIVRTEASVAHISEESRQIPQTMESLKIVLEVNQHQIEELGRHLQAFKECSEKAVEAVPKLQKQVEETVINITNATQHLAAGINESAEQAKVAIVAGTEALNNKVRSLSTNLVETSDMITEETEKIRAQLGTTTVNLESGAREMIQLLKEAGMRVKEDTHAISQEFTNNIEELQKRLESMLQEASRVQTSEMSKVFSELDQAMRQAVKQTGESVNKQFEVFDKSMIQEVNRTIEEMGKALATITGRFTEDYQKLIKAMNNTNAVTRREQGM